MNKRTRRSGAMMLKDRTALITGAGGGMGRAIALALARRGTHLALLDIDGDGLSDTAALAKAEGVRVSTYRLDLADAEAVRGLPDQVSAQHPGLDLLINNAGVALGGTFQQLDEADFDWLFQVNFWGTVRMTRAFLPILLRSDDARIVNLSSLYGLVAPRGQTAYAASKFAVRGFSMALAAELAGHPLGVTIVYPGGVATRIVDNARMAASLSADEAHHIRARSGKYLRITPDVAGEVIVRGIERRRNRVLVGWDARILSTIERLLPGSHHRVLARLS